MLHYELMNYDIYIAQRSVFGRAFSDAIPDVGSWNALMLVPWNASGDVEVRAALSKLSFAKMRNKPRRRFVGITAPSSRYCCNAVATRLLMSRRI